MLRHSLFRHIKFISTAVEPMQDDLNPNITNTAHASSSFHLKTPIIVSLSPPVLSYLNQHTFVMHEAKRGCALDPHCQESHLDCLQPQQNDQPSETKPSAPLNTLSLWSNCETCLFQTQILHPSLLA